MDDTELDRIFRQSIEILAEPGRFLVAFAATAVAQIIGKAVGAASSATISMTVYITPTAV